MLEQGSLRTVYEKRIARLDDTVGLFLTHVRCASAAAGGQRNDYVFFDDAASSKTQQLAVMAGSPPREGERSSLCLITEMPPSFDGLDRAEYRQHKSQLAERSLEMARRFVPGIGDDGAILDAASPQTFERWTLTRGGSAYGALRPARGRRLNAHTPVPNLFLAGQSVLYPGIMGAIASGLVACCHIVGAEKVWELLRA